jgi:hypothetical protein
LTSVPPSEPLMSPDAAVVFTRWLSMIAAAGAGSRPACRRTLRRQAAWTRCQTPCRRHRRNVAYTVCQGGYARGRSRQAQPVRRTSKISLTSRRGAQRRGRPRRAGPGNRDDRCAHSTSGKSQG